MKMFDCTVSGLAVGTPSKHDTQLGAKLPRGVALSQAMARLVLRQVAYVLNRRQAGSGPETVMRL